MTEDGTPYTTGKRQYVVKFLVHAGSPVAGHTVQRSGITTAKDVTFLGVQRGKTTLPFSSDVVLQAMDV